jgi:hypothetical protein
MNRGRRNLTGILALLAVALATGCASAPPQPESMRDPGVDFAAFRTFGWAPAPGVNEADQPLLLLDRSIRDAIGAEMRRRGYVESPDNPDLRIAYETASQEKIESNPVRVGIGMGSWGGNFGGSVNVGSPSVRNYREGTLVIHAIDAARNAEVWQGRVSGRIGKESLEPAAVAVAVATAMRDFPARPAP